MNEILPDGRKPIQIGDPSYVYKNVYNPIVWLGKDPYRPRVEMLVIKDGRYVFTRRYEKNDSDENFKYNYRIPGGSIDQDSTKLEQAVAETNEEGLIDVVEPKFSGLSYYEQYPGGFLLKGGDSPLEYKGSMNDVFVAKYFGKYDKSKVEEKDLDDDMAKNGRFHSIVAVANELKPEHKQALINSGYVDQDIVRFLRLTTDVKGTSVDGTTQVDPTKEPLRRPEMNTITESSDIIVPGGYLYHGSTYQIEEFKPMSLDIGNVNQKPGWSTFCFDNREMALRFGLMRLIQKVTSNMDPDRVPEKWRKLKVGWSVMDQKPFVSMENFNPHFYTGETFYIYKIKADGLNIGIGNDSKLQEYTFRESGVKPESTEVITVDSSILLNNVILTRDFDQVLNANEDSYAGARGAYAAMLNHDYNGDSVVAKLEKAVADGELKPGEDVTAYMDRVGLSFEKSDFLSKIEDITDSENGSSPLSEASLTAEERKNIPDKEYGLPKKRKYPMPDKKHVRAAIRFFNYVEKEDEAELARNINKRAKALGMVDEITVGSDNRFSKYWKGAVTEATMGPGKLSAFKLVDNPSRDFVEAHVEDAPCIKDFLDDSVRKNSCMFVDKTNNKVAAVFMVFDDRGHKIINNFEVTPGYRGQGLSKDLLDYAVKRKGGDHLWVSDDNTIAKNLYTKYGFKPTGDTMKDGKSTKSYMALEQAVSESFLFSKDTLYINFDKFQSGDSNVCLVTGLSGSGKSTIAQKIAKENKAEWIELDLFENCSMFTTDDQLKEAGEVFYEYLSSHQDIWEKLKGKELHGKDLTDEVSKFTYYCIAWCKKHNDAKWVIEGVQIYSIEKSKSIRNLPTIIIGASVLKSIAQRLKRAKENGELKDNLSELPQLIGYYVDNDKALTQFRNAIVQEASDGNTSTGAGVVPFDVAKTIEDIISNDRMFISQSIWDNMDNIVYYDTAEVAGSTVGSIIVFKDMDTKIGHVMLSVDTSATGFGVANQMMDDLFFNWTNLGCAELRVTMRKDYDESYKLFKSYGFQEVYSDDEDTITMAFNENNHKTGDGVKVEESDLVLQCKRELMFQKYHVSPFPVPMYGMDTTYKDSLHDAIWQLKLFWPMDTGLYYVFAKINDRTEIPIGRIILRKEDNWAFTGWYDCFPFNKEQCSQFLTTMRPEDLTESAINLVQKVLRGEHDFGTITESAGEYWLTISTPDKIVMEAPGDDTPTDYTQNALSAGGGNTITDDTPTDYTQGGAGEEPAGDDTGAENENPMGTGTEDDAGGGDMMGEEPTDYTDDGGDDFGGEGDDMGGEAGGEEPTDTGADTTASDTPNNNTLVKNYSLIRDFEKIYSLIDDINSTIDSTLKATSVENQILVQVSRNLTNIKDFVIKFIQFHFKDNDYEYNLYYYTMVVQFLKFNLSMVERMTLLSQKN